MTAISYEFDPGEPDAKRKHRPRATGASYRCAGGRIISTCPRGYDKTRAEALLNDRSKRFEIGDGRSPGPHPDAMYVFDEDVLFRVEPTCRTQNYAAYHAFPEYREHFEKKVVGTIKENFDRWARKRGIVEAIDKWLDKTESWQC